MADLLEEVVGNFTGILGKALQTVKTRAEDLANKVKIHSEDVAQDIAAYGDKILWTIGRRVRGEITAADALITIKNWKQAMKSALKKLKVFSEWEAYDQFWGLVSSVFKIVGALLGEIAL